MNTKVLKEKTEVLTRLISLTADLYHQEDLSSSQRDFLETIIGAGLWYLPSDKKILFNGKISRAALAQLKAEPSNTKLVEEHFLPRKIAGRTLYTKHVDEIREDGNRLQELYLTQMGKFNYVLKGENSRMAKFQRANNYVDEATSYQQAGIEMVPITIEEVELLLKRQV